jgi:3-isopropylmalate dehydrogenase
MMLRYTFGLTAEADAVEEAVSKVLDASYRTADIYTDGMKLVGTKEMGDLIAQAL